MKTSRICAGLILAVAAVTSFMRTGHAQQPPPPVALTIHLIGLGSPPITGAVDVIPKGSVCGNADGTTACTYQFAPGTAMKLTSNAPGGSTPGVFSLGAGDAAGCATSTCTFTLNNNSEVTATFDPGAPVFTVSINLAGDAPGEIGADNNRCQNYDFDPAHLPTQFSACQTSYAPHSMVTLQANAPAATRFSNYSNGTNTATVCGVDAVCGFSLENNTSITASFSRLTALTVDPSSSTITIGQTQSYIARGTYADGTSAEAIAQGHLGTWTTKASMSQTRFDFAAAVAGGRVYALGGLDGSGQGSSLLGSVEAYDPLSNQWSSRHSMSPRAGLAAGTIDDRFVYAVGGDISGACPVDTLEMYDSVADAWTTKAPMPGGPRRLLSAAVVGRKLYAIGGELNECFTTSGTVLGRMEAYDPDTDQWTRLPDMPTARRFFGAGVVNGIIYAVGGDDTHDNLATVEAFDPATNTWSTKAPLPASRSLLAVAVIDNVLYAIGGNSGGYFNSVFAYDAVSDTWSNKAFMPSVITQLHPSTEVSGVRGELAAASLNDRLYALGGLVAPGGQPPVSIVFSFVDSLIWSTDSAAVAPIAQSGLARGFSVGSTTVTARAGATVCEPASCGTLNVTAPAHIPPVVTIFSGGSFISEGQSILMNGNFNDSDSHAWIATVDFGDGSGVQPLAVTPGSGGLGPAGSFASNHTYADNGSYTVTVTVTDAEGTAGSATQPVTVTNVAPSLNLPNSALTQAGNANTWACGSFRDPGVNDGPWIGQVNYGDGSGTQSLTMLVPPSGPCAGPGGSGGPTGSFGFNHAYSQGGTFTMTITVRDKDGAVATGTVSVTVSSPAIQLGLPQSLQTQTGSTSSWGCGSFFDGNSAAGPWSGTVNYGDGSDSQPLALIVPPSGPCAGSGGTGGPTGAFSFVHSYSATGTFTVNVTVSNHVGVSRSGSVTVTVNSGGGGDHGCAEITMTLSSGNVPPGLMVQMTVLDRTTGQSVFAAPVPLGFTDFGQAPAGSYRFLFAPPAGYIVTPAQLDVDVTCGNNVALVARVDVLDTTPPALTLNGSNPMVIEGGSAFGDPGANAIDAVDGTLTAQIVVSGAVNPNVVGAYVLTYTVSDHAGNASSVMRTVRVVDTTPPAIDPHANITVPAKNAHGAVVRYTAPATHDAISGNGVAICSPASGSTFRIGTTTVVCTATDGAHNSSSSSFAVTVTRKHDKRHDKGHDDDDDDDDEVGDNDRR